jgi:hypothetical protein
LKIPSASINVLTPEVTDKEIAAAPAMASEQPGMGEAIGAVVGGAMGVAGEVGFAPANFRRTTKAPAYLVGF